jgi:hypothetical protein
MAAAPYPAPTASPSPAPGEPAIRDVPVTFARSTTVPWWARLFRGSFRVTLVAHDASGAQTQTTASVRI